MAEDKKENLEPGNEKELNTKETQVLEEKHEEHSDASRKHKKMKDKDLIKSLESLQIKHDELNDKYLRLYSEFDNYRKRTIREKGELLKMGSEDLIKELLPVLDDFNRAHQAIQDANDIGPIKDGLELVMNKFYNTLLRKGLKPIETMGQHFNTDLHEAITQIPSPSEEQKGKVIDEIEKGYYLHDKVIRYAKVVVGT